MHSGGVELSLHLSNQIWQHSVSAAASCYRCHYYSQRRENPLNLHACTQVVENTVLSQLEFVIRQSIKLSSRNIYDSPNIHILVSLQNSPLFFPSSSLPRDVSLTNRAQNLSSHCQWKSYNCNDLSTIIDLNAFQTLYK